jgi:hypothetical protein
MGTNGTNLLVSQTAVNYGAKHQMWEATAFEEAGVHQGKGLHYEIKVYMLKNER